MGSFNFYNTEIEGVVLFDCFYSGDIRGGFTKSFEESLFKSNGINFNLSETFSSYSSNNVIRGLHFQIHSPQSKIITVLSGSIWDVVVDLRPKSTTFKKWISFELNEYNHRGVYIPKGFAHGFLAKRDNTIMQYQCDGKYDKETDSGIRFDDPDLGIIWPIKLKDAIHSERDLKLQSFRSYLADPMLF